MKLGLGVKIGGAICAMVLVQNVAAEQYSFIGHRATGMGGANAASVNDSSAQWQNPAAFGFFSRDPDPVEGVVTNAITNVILQVVDVAVTNSVVVTNSMAVAESADTNAVAALAAVDSPDTNAVAEVEEDNANMVAAADSLSTNEVVSYVQVTNETYDIKYEVVMQEHIPERARADNGGLEKRDFGWNLLGLGFGYTMTEDMPEYVTQASLIDFDSFDGGGLEGTIEGVESMILLGSTLYGMGSNPDNAFYADANVGMNFRMGKLGIGVRGFTEAAGFVDTLDTYNLGVEQTEGQFIGAINSAAVSDDGFNPIGYNYQTIDPGDLNISGTVPGDQAEAYLDYQLTQLKNDGVMSDQSIDDAVFMLNLVSYDQDPNDPTSRSYENNKSTVTLRGFGLFEVPVSYGYAFNDNFSIGLTAKGMYGTVTGTKFRFADGSELEDSIEVLDENTEASFNFGIDIAAMYRMKMLQFAVVGHNINAPKFDGFDTTIDIENDDGVVVDTVALNIPDHKIDPQVTLGAAFIPSERFMIEMSYDLLETGTLLDNYDIQRISFGTELDLWILALRLGMYNNLAVDWQDWVATGGIGLDLWAIQFDVGGAYSIGDNTEFEGNEIPEEARLYAAISFEF